MTQLKELEAFNSDIRQNCRRARRRLPTPQSGKIVVCPVELFPMVISHQRLIVTNFRALHNKVYETAQGLSGKLLNFVNSKLHLQTKTQQMYITMIPLFLFLKRVRLYLMENWKPFYKRYHELYYRKS